MTGKTKNRIAKVASYAAFGAAAGSFFMPVPSLLRDTAVAILATPLVALVALATLEVLVRVRPRRARRAEDSEGGDAR